MLLWKIRYWNNEETGNSPVEKWLSKLTDEKLAMISEELSKLAQRGNELNMPHSKALGQGLFELREREFGLRIYYGFNGECIVILLAAGDKTSQDRDIKTARTRLLTIKKGK